MTLRYNLLSIAFLRCRWAVTESSASLVSRTHEGKNILPLSGSDCRLQSVLQSQKGSDSARYKKYISYRTSTTRINQQPNRIVLMAANTPTSSTATCNGLDGYGESDSSLVCYKSDAVSSHSALSLEEANELLNESLTRYPPFSRYLNIEQVISDSCLRRKSYSFTAAQDLRINVQIRVDVQQILFLTAVHHVEHGQQDSFSPRTGRYSLLTKMMKYNAILCQTSGCGRVVLSSCKRSFVFFQDLDMCALYGITRHEKLSNMLEDFLWKAMEMRRDFAGYSKY